MKMPKYPAFVAISSNEAVNFLDYESNLKSLPGSAYIGCMYEYNNLKNTLLEAYKRKLADKKLELYNEITNIKDNLGPDNDDNCLRVFIKTFDENGGVPEIPQYLTNQNKEKVFEVIKTLNDNLIHFVSLLKILKLKRWDIDLIPRNLPEFFKYLFSGEAEEILILFLVNFIYAMLVLTFCCWCLGSRRRHRDASIALQALRHPNRQ